MVHLLNDSEIGPNDVLLGAGRHTVRNEGNKRFRELVRKRKEVYSTANKLGAKKAIAQGIIKEVLVDREGRFLRKNGKLWVSETEEKPLLRVVQDALRCKSSEQPRASVPAQAASSDKSPMVVDENRAPRNSVSNKVAHQSAQSIAIDDLDKYVDLTLDDPEEEEHVARVPACQPSTGSTGLGGESSPDYTEVEEEDEKDGAPSNSGHHRHPVESPIGPNDVLLGPGAHTVNNEGNKRFRDLVQGRKDEYFTANELGAKNAIAQEIIKEVIEVRKGSFLRKYGELWVSEKKEKPLVQVVQGAFRRAKGSSQQPQASVPAPAALSDASPMVADENRAPRNSVSNCLTHQPAQSTTIDDHDKYVDLTLDDPEDEEHVAKIPACQPSTGSTGIGDESLPDYTEVEEEDEDDIVVMPPTYDSDCDEDDESVVHETGPDDQNLVHVIGSDAKGHEIGPDGKISISEIGPDDVVLGSGTHSIQTKGSIRYRKLVLKYKDEYSMASDPDKQAIAQGIIDVIHKEGGIFSRKTGKFCVPVTKARALLDVVEHALRRPRGGSQESQASLRGPILCKACDVVVIRRDGMMCNPCVLECTKRLAEQRMYLEAYYKEVGNSNENTAAEDYDDAETARALQVIKKLEAYLDRHARALAKEQGYSPCAGCTAGGIRKDVPVPAFTKGKRLCCATPAEESNSGRSIKHGNNCRAYYARYVIDAEDGDPNLAVARSILVDHRNAMQH